VNDSILSSKSRERTTDVAEYFVSPKLEETTHRFQHWLYLPDPTPLYGTLATVAANLMPGDPVWLLLIGPPSGGKTEILNSILTLPHMHGASTLSEAGLLSATPAKERSKTASGGLLREVGEFGIAVFKDFTSVLSMSRDQRALTLAALREIYDGHWIRRLGVDGGKQFEWRGKMGFLAGCTDAIETHHHVIATMGDRYVRQRMPVVDPKEQGLRASANQGREAEMRRALEEAVEDLFRGLNFSEAVHVDENYKLRINSLATFAAIARSPVERDSYKREIEYVPDAEQPARICKSLIALFGGALKIGVCPDGAFECIRRVAFDSIPKVRRQLLMSLLQARSDPTTENFIQATCLPKTTIERTLEDLQVHRIVESYEGSSERKGDIVWRLEDGRDVLRGSGKSWSLTGDAAALLDDAGCLIIG
jgi:hypothetical protein